jgi:hypothetical protein
MKNLLLGCICLIAGLTSASAQCEKKITWTGAKAEFLDASGAVSRTLDEKVVVVSSKTEIKLMHSDREDDALSGKIKEFSCTWTDPFKNGKTVIKSDLTENNADTKSSTVTIEAKDGKITILLTMEDAETKIIKLYIDSYKETD